jgi:hypothetical protein
MRSPPKRDGALLHAPIPKLRLLLPYNAAKILSNATGWLFWLVERWRSELADQIDNEEHDR